MCSISSVMRISPLGKTSRRMLRTSCTMQVLLHTLAGSGECQVNLLESIDYGEFLELTRQTAARRRSCSSTIGESQRLGQTLYRKGRKEDRKGRKGKSFKSLVHGSGYA